MLRINPDGIASRPTTRSITPATGNNRAIWALGLRNPFTFAFSPVGAEMFINDVGQNTWEEIDDGIAGANYGWPDTEGATNDPRSGSPLCIRPQRTGACAITGGAFYAPLTPQFPADYAPATISSPTSAAAGFGNWDVASGGVTTFAIGIASLSRSLAWCRRRALGYPRGANAVYRVK